MKKKSSYSYEELIDCGNGRLFGPGNAKLPLPPMLMFDRISEISENTGTFKKGLIKANKVGGQYRILGKEILRLVSPEVEKKAVKSYLDVKKKVVDKINGTLKQKNKENLTLVKEIHHRVKNNLQIIISLLRLQKGELKSLEAKEHFTEAINRIMVMSLIHKKLYQQEELASISIKSYLEDLSSDIISITSLGKPVEVVINSNIETIGLKTIVPLGLLIK